MTSTVLYENSSDIRDLEGKVVVVTGATGGLGAAMARSFAAAGARLVLTGRNADAGNTLVRSLSEEGAQAWFCPGDLREVATIENIRSLVVEHLEGRIDVVVLNAGVISFGPLTDMTTEQYDDMMNVNVRAPWMCIRELHSLIADGGSVLVTSSVSAFTYFPGEGVYCMTKAAVSQMVRSLAVELGSRGIRVNAICPGVIDEAGMSHDAFADTDDPEAESRNAAAISPLRRNGQPHDVSRAAVYLASDASAFITGSSLVIDGGVSIPRLIPT
ncbi:SDR family NAD(P)-dependent oxidoreductase [Rhodococcus opacus]|uniref:SDR family NAD(P)-dependent oxidoreductase n=2 Tax=Rhodococcus opacus TaxID=37919 RepID=UPI0005C482F6|nr:SDR family oxidoreductase [Rhodococcus opacus]UDH01580.1 SDR family oxidoreductase [Rhodococcus opacus PD630]